MKFEVRSILPLTATAVALGFLAVASSARMELDARGVRGGGEVVGVKNSGDCNQRNGYAPCAVNGDLCHYCSENAPRQVADDELQGPPASDLRATKDCGHIMENGTCTLQADGSLKCVGAVPKTKAGGLIRAVCEYVTEIKAQTVPGVPDPPTTP
jgi:hypothetical protein